MTYEMYRYVFIGGLVLAGLVLLLAVLLFFLLKIPVVIGDLSGATARKAIENIRKENAKTGEKTYKSSQVNIERGRVTDKMTPSGKLLRRPNTGYGGAMATEKIGTDRLQAEADASFTSAVGAEETTVLYPGDETTVLSDDTLAFRILYEVTLIHTNERIS